MFSVLAGSFYGDSSVITPYQESSSSTQLSLQFKTHLPDGLLFLALGTTDYLLLKLADGNVAMQTNFGSGEITLNSTGSLKYNDGHWHQIYLNKRLEIISLQIDGTEQLQTYADGSFTQLDIQKALFLGGIGQYNKLEIPIDRIPYGFRGCLNNVIFNRYNVFGSLQNTSHVNRASVKHVDLWDCNVIFDASTETPLSFSSPHSYVAFRDEANTTGTRFITLDVRTPSRMALLFFTVFNSDENSSHKEFLALECVNGKSRLTISCAKVKAVIETDGFINTGQWQTIMIEIHPNIVRLIHARVAKEANFLFCEHHVKKFQNLIFIGGFGYMAAEYDQYLSLLNPVSILSSKSSAHYQFQGCLRNIYLGLTSPVGFTNLYMSKDVSMQCSESYACDSETAEGGHCNSQRSDEAATRNQLTNTDSDTVQLVEVYALEVDEGSEKVITTDNIKITFNHKEYRIRESAIQFHIISPPEHGEVMNHLGTRRNKNVFTLLDMIGNKISYRHDGSEESLDQMSLEMDIVTDSEEIPEGIVSRYAFVLLIKIRPENDSPVLTLHTGGHIKMVQGTKFRMSTNVLSVTDPDTLLEDITLTMDCRCVTLYNCLQILN